MSKHVEACRSMSKYFEVFRSDFVVFRSNFRVKKHLQCMGKAYVK